MQTPQEARGIHVYTLQARSLQVGSLKSPVSDTNTAPTKIASVSYKYSTHWVKAVVVDIFLTTSAALTLAVPLLVVLYQAFAAAGYPDRSYAILSIAIPILVVALIVLCIIKQIYDWNASWANRPESENKLVCILQNKSDQYGARTKESQMDEAVSNQVSLAQALDIFISL